MMGFSKSKKESAARKLKVLHGGIVLLFALTSCDHGSSGNAQARQPSNHASGGAFITVQSDEELTSHIKQSLSAIQVNESPYRGDVAMPTATPMPATAPSPEADADDSASGGNYSSTYLQVNGVDEADQVKYDGKFLFIAATVTATEKQAKTATPMSSIPSYAPSMPERSIIKVLETFAAPVGTEEVAQISLPDANTRLSGMYLTPASDEQPPLLTAITSPGYAYSWHDWGYPSRWQDSSFEILQLDISNPRDSTLVATYEQQGSLLTSRKIGNTIYLISRYSPNIDGFSYYPYSDTEINENQNIIDSLSLDDLLPSYQTSNDAEFKRLEAEDCLIAENNAAYQNGAVGIIVITAIDVRSPNTPRQTCLIANPDSYYVSTQAIYLLERIYDTSSDKEDVNYWYRPQSTSTMIHKLALTESGATYRGTGSVPGKMESFADPQFLMGESAGVFKVITTMNDEDNTTGRWQYTHRLSLIKEDDNTEGVLTEVAHLPNDDRPAKIGKPNEHVYAVRYKGDKAYVVTFLKTDPFYVINTSDIYDPYIAGELQIPGYSSLLHVVDENLVLGMGIDTVEGEAGSFAWFQGFKAELFNVSDITHPVSQGTIDIGKRGSSSPIQNNHHAFTFLPGTGSEPHRLTMPVIRNATARTYNNYDNIEGNNYYDYTDTGLYLVEISGHQNPSEASLDIVGSIIAHTAEQNGQYGYRPNYSLHRSIIDGDAVHYIYGDQVLSANWEMIKKNIESN